MKVCKTLFPPEDTFACKECGAQFESAAALRRHSGEHTAQSVRCKDCGLLVPMLDYVKHSATHAALGSRCALHCKGPFHAGCSAQAQVYGVWVQSKGWGRAVAAHCVKARQEGGGWTGLQRVPTVRRLHCRGSARADCV